MMARTAAGRLEGFARVVQARRRAWDVPGVAVGVVCAGETVFAEGFGTRRAGRDLPVSAGTVFAICSCTKAFTSTLLAMLVDDGVLEWNRPLREYLPEFALRDAFATERMTALDLVTHRSGLPRHDYAWYGSPATRPELFARLRHLEPTRDLRTTYQYQNLMYMTAGVLAGRLADSTWEAQLRARILEPLGMASTTTSVTASQADPAAARPHERHRGRVREVPFRDLDALGPAGSINSTARDMLRWLRLHLGGGAVDGKRLVSAAQWRRMLAPQMPIPDFSPFDEFCLASYGLGWSVVSYRGHRLATHSGGIDGFRCRALLLPDDDLGAVVLTNGATSLPHALCWELTDRLLGLEPRPWSRRLKAADAREARDPRRRWQEKRSSRVRATKPSHRLDAYVGDYRHPGYGAVSVRRAGRGLAAALNLLEGRLAHFHYDVFAFHQRRWPTPFLVRFGADAAGRIDHLAIPLQEGAPEIVFARAGDTP